MKVSKKNRNIIVFLALFLVINFSFIYKKLNNKEKLLCNQMKVIKKLENEKIKNKYKEDLVISFQKYFKDVATIKYIKTDHNSEKEIELEGEISGDKNLISQSIKNINDSTKNITLNSIKINKINENTIDCSFKVKVY